MPHEYVQSLVVSVLAGDQHLMPNHVDVFLCESHVLLLSLNFGSVLLNQVSWDEGLFCAGKSLFCVLLHLHVLQLEVESIFLMDVGCKDIAHVIWSGVRSIQGNS